MSIQLYMDEHVHGAVTRGLRRRNVDVLTVQEDGMASASDPEVLDRAGDVGRVVFTQDIDFLIEATRRLRNGESFAGVIYAAQLGVSIGKCIEDLEVIAQATDIEDHLNQVGYLPL